MTLNITGVNCSGGTWQAGPFDTDTWGDASYTISTTMVDGAGNPETAAVTATVTKDTTSRAVAISIPLTPINQSNKDAYPVSGTCSNHTGAVRVTIGGTATPTTAPSCTSGAWSTQVGVDGVSDGANVTVSASFGTGTEEVTDSVTVLKDTVLPTVAITQPTAINRDNQDSYSLSGTCSEEGANVNVNIGSIAATVNCASGAWSIANYDLASGGLTGSTIAITADITDAAGNDATQASASVTRDVDAPVVTITSTDRVINIADNNQFSLSGTCTVGDGNVSIQIGNLTGITTACDVNGQWSLVNEDVTNLGEGVGLVLIAQQTDVVSNTGEVEENTITKDIQAPTVTLTSSTQVNDDNEDSFLLEGTCSDNRVDSITIVASDGIDTVGNSSNIDCSNNVWDYRIGLGDLSDGNIDLSIVHQDQAANRTPINPTLSKDTVAATLTVELDSEDNLRAINAENEASYTFSGTCNEAQAQITIAINGLGNNLSTSCNQDNTWEIVHSFNGVTDSATFIPVTITIADGHDNRFEIVTSIYQGHRTAGGDY